MANRVFILAFAVAVCDSYIVSIGDEHECITVVCENGGMLQNETCTCACDWEHTGFFCETKLLQSEWPHSEYSILMSSFGCPEEKTRGWEHGYINMTNSLTAPVHLWNFNMTHDDIYYNKTYYPKPNVLGPFHKHSIQLNFCTKVDHLNVNDITEIQWAEGNYCILKSRFNCPDGFITGSINMTGYRVESHDVGGHLPDLDISESYITLKFCCRDDGDILKPIILPASFPFNLYMGPSTDNCQEVNGMVVQKDIFYMTDIDQSWSFNGSFPSLDTVSYEQRIGIPYCYYSPYAKKDCYYKSDNGNSYDGRMNISESGKPCLNWRQVSSDYLNSWRWFGEFEENYCRGYTEQKRPPTRPVCVVEMNGTEEYCSIPLCDEDSDMQLFGTHKPFYSSPGENGNAALDGVFFKKPRFYSFRPAVKPWFQIDLQEHIRVHNIHTYRTAETNCGRPLGLITGNIYSYQIDASSVFEEQQNVYTSYKGRLLNPGVGWCSDPATDTQPWFSVDLISPIRLQGLLLQGWYEDAIPRFIRKFTISYGVRRNQLTTLEDPIGIQKVFRLDPAMLVSSIQRIMFSKDILARWIQINPISEAGERACLKLELIGCPRQAVRDLFCRQDSANVDFGFAVVHYRAWWLSPYIQYIVLPWNETTTCSELCLQKHCVSTNEKTNGGIIECSIYASHRFKIEYYDWWVPSSNSAKSSHRLCFKEFAPIDACDRSIQILGNSTHFIDSPGSPLMYEQGLNCTWHITTERNRYVKLEMIYINLAETISLTNLIKMGFYDINPGTCNDTLNIFDKSLGKKTVISDDDELGYTDSIFISSSNTLTVNFLSCIQSSPQKQNYFKIKASSIDFPGCGMVGTEYTVRCVTPTAYIANNGFPAKYTESVEMWTIEGVFGQYVQFEFINLDVVDLDDMCSKSYVAIYDTNIKGEEHFIGRYCTLKRPYFKILSKWHTMRVEFRSDSSKGGRGFLGKYSLIDYANRYENIDVQGCAIGWYRGGNSCYKLEYFDDNNKTVSKGLTWVTSEKLCNEQGGHLVSINNPDEMNIIHSLLTTTWDLKDNIEFYIGLHKSIEKGTFTWTDQSPLTYTAWYVDPNTKTSQPDGFANERCTSLTLESIHATDNWKDIACAFDQIYSYICEKNITTSVEEDLHDQLVDIYSTQNVNSSIHFICENNNLISRLFVCDGKNDCGDASDELDCDVQCNEKQFQCDNGACISLALYCDFVPHCEDGSDEYQCVRASCSMNEWQCSNKQCIPNKQRCDLQNNCVDGSDEKLCDECNENSFQCYDQQCLPRSLVCDGFTDCAGRFNEDERNNCQNNVQRSCSEWWSLGKRTNGEYLINLGRSDIVPAVVECEFEQMPDNVIVKTRVHHLNEEMVDNVEKEVHIDLIYNADNTIIASLKESTECSQFLHIRCKNIPDETSLHWTAFNGDTFDLRIIDDNCSCPFVNNCAADSDRCNCSTTRQILLQMEDTDKLEDSGIITNETQLPIKRIDTVIATTREPHKRFEIVIGPFECKETLFMESVSFLCRNGVTTPATIRCLLDYDRYGGIIGCRDLSHLDDCETFICPLGFVKCKDSFCIPIRLMCDSKTHCSSGEDEQYCGNVTCPGLFKCRESNICLEPNKVCDGFPDCPTFDDELLCLEQCPFNCNCADHRVTCIGNKQFNISDISAETRKLELFSMDFKNALPDFIDFSTLAELNISFCKIRKIMAGHFQGLGNLLTLDLSFNLLETLVANTFYGLKNLRHLLLYGNVNLVIIEPMAFFGLQKLPHLEITKTKLKYLMKNTFNGLSNAKHINLSNNDIQQIDNDAFMSLGSLLELDLKHNNIKDFSNQIFKGLDSLHLLQTDDYVFCCLRPSTVSSENCFPQRDEFSSCADLMRNDMLRWFLWIIGVFALLGNLAVLIYKFVFDRQSLEKGHGILITNLSISDFCMGIYLLIIASADMHFRGRYVWNDRAWRQGSLCKFAGVMSTISSECSVIFLCFITIDRILVVKFPFGQYRFTQRKTMTASIIAWIVVIFIAVVPLFVKSYFNDEFYSRSAVCLALPLTRNKPSGWEYGTAIFIFLNFAIFIVIAFGQLVIYKEVTMAADARVKTQRKKLDLVIARRLFLVMFTDFICWFPVGVMGLMALSGNIIPGEVYAFTTVFILPVNSALNPFLYTFSAIKNGKIGNISRKKGNKASSRTDLTPLQRGWEELMDNNKFIIGKRSEKFYTLCDHLEKDGLTVEQMTSIMKAVVTEMAFLHERCIIHGPFQLDDIVLEYAKGRIGEVRMKISPKNAIEDIDFAEDMLEVGQLVKAILRSGAQNWSTKEK